MTPSLTAALVADTRCGLGESPFWNPTSSSLTWLDIDASTMWNYSESLGLTSSPVPDETTFAALTNTGGVIAAHASGVDLMGHGGASQRVVEGWLDASKYRTNDGAVDSKGRLWMGHTTRDRTPGSGDIGVIIDGVWARRVSDLTLPNGIGWSPDDATIYYVDTFGHTLWSADYDAESATLGSARRLYEMPAERGLMDGLAVDAEGRIWVAVWGGSAVLRLDPDGSVVGRAVVGAPKVTSCAFAGETLFITTADPDQTDPHGSGGLFAVDAGVAGVPVTPMQSTG